MAVMKKKAETAVSPTFAYPQPSWRGLITYPSQMAHNGINYSLNIGIFFGGGSIVMVVHVLERISHLRILSE